MELVKKTASSATIRLAIAELTALNNGLNEALDTVPEWEFETRMGLSSHDAQELLTRLGKILDQLA